MEPSVEFSDISGSDFEAIALDVFRYQAEHNNVYREFVRLLGREISSVKSLTEIPFLPVVLFRSQKIVTGQWDAEAVFTSSGTTGSMTSRHYVKSLDLYQRSFMAGFDRFYGDIRDCIILALLPSYLERDGSSLVYMADRMIAASGSELSGFYLNNYDDLIEALAKGRRSGKRVILLGVTYALLHLAERYAPDLSGIIVMETGGMKGMRREMVREELHAILNSAFGTTKIDSEYGMTELLSQAYSTGNGRFRTPPWMKVLIGDINDPLSVSDTPGSPGTINVIDLANIWSCSFLATSDLGRLHGDGTFEITGRYDNSDLRGCNLLVAGGE
jgi:phenylacetate-coenzyme A ligase PaaK-like adenylate-forming protein